MGINDSGTNANISEQNEEACAISKNVGGFDIICASVISMNVTWMTK
jgi:hypothetical protein